MHELRVDRLRFTLDDTAALLEASGVRAGAYLSPHLHHSGGPPVQLSLLYKAADKVAHDCCSSCALPHLHDAVAASHLMIGRAMQGHKETVL